MIETRALAYQFASGPRIEFPDVDLPQGACMVLSGPSGSGKSTWLALACGLRRSSAGQIVASGQDLAALRGAPLDRWRGAHVGFLPQRLHLSAALDVSGNLDLAYVARGLKPDQARIQAVLAALGVAELAARKPAQLSVGQAQRVALARALLMSPQLILADEPTASLDDAAAAAAVALLVDSAAQSGATLVLATHDARVRAALPTALRLELK